MTKRIALQAERLEAQMAEVMQLIAGVQADLAACSADPAAPPSVVAAAAALSERQAVLTDTIAEIRSGSTELELHLAQRSEQLAEREAALETSREQLRTLTHRLVQVQEDERRSLARDLHDTSSEAMTVIGLGLTMLGREATCSEKVQARIQELRAMAATVGEDLHRLSVNLRPSSLDRYGLVPAVEERINSMRRQSAIEVEFRAEGLEDRLPADMETAVYRIVQEACTNIVRYAGASRASVAVRKSGDALHVVVQDNGSGFDVDEALSRGRLGLLGMRERAEMLGGAFSLDTRPGQGTTIRVDIPLAAIRSGVPAATATDLGPPVGGDLPESAAATSVPSAAAELARAKALSDTLVAIMAGMSQQATAEDLLAFVVALSAEAIACDFAVVVLREADHWVLGQGYHLPRSAIGRRMDDAELPAALQIEASGEVLIVNDLRVEGPHFGLAHDSGALSGAGIPLVAGGKFFGVLAYLHTTAAVPFSPSEVEFLRRLSSLVSLALQNVHLNAVERRQREVLEAVVATVPVGLAAVRGEALEIQLANQAYRSVTAHPEVDPTGRRFADIWHLGEGPDPAEAWLTGVLQSGEPLDVPHHTRVYSDGAQRHFAFHIRPLYREGEPAALVVCLDTTAAEEAAATERQLAAERDAVLSSINDGLFIFDREGRIVHVNGAGAEILRYQGPEPGTRFQDLRPRLRPRKPDGQLYAVAELPAIRALKGETVRAEVMALELAEGTAWVSASAAPIYGPAGVLQGGVATFTDITPLHLAQEELEEANRKLQAAYGELHARAEELAEVNYRLAHACEG